jgi:hypothetical protein
MICRAVCVGWKEIACVATQIADLAVYEDCATDGRTRHARLVQGLGIRALLEVLFSRQVLISPSAHLETVLMIEQPHTAYLQTFFLKGGLPGQRT